MLTINLMLNATVKKCVLAIFCLIVVASVSPGAAAQVTLNQPRDTGLKKDETPKVQKLPDLVVTTIQYSGTYAVISVHNKGIETSAPCKLNFKLTAEQPGEQWTVPVPALIAKGFVHTTKISRHKPFAGKGVAKIDPDNQITESNEINNVLTIDQPAALPDIAAVGLSFKDEGGTTVVVGRVQNVGKVNLIGAGIKVHLIRIVKYGSHQNTLDLKTENLPNLIAGATYDVKAPMPKPFPGADSYIWILRVDGDGNDANNKAEKKSTKVDNN